MKMVRIMVVLKAAYNQLRKIGRPRLISPVKIGKCALQENLLANILAFFCNVHVPFCCLHTVNGNAGS